MFRWQKVCVRVCAHWLLFGLVSRSLAMDVSLVEMVHVALHFRNARAEEAISPIPPLEGSSDIVSRLYLDPH